MMMLTLQATRASFINSGMAGFSLDWRLASDHRRFTRIYARWRVQVLRKGFSCSAHGGS
jgi:hypothetical protein